MTKVFAHYDGRAIIPDQPLDLLPDDLLEVTITVRPRVAVEEPPPGSPAAILAALKSMPPIDPDTAALFERSLAEADAERKAEALREMARPGIFDEPI